MKKPIIIISIVIVVVVAVLFLTARSRSDNPASDTTSRDTDSDTVNESSSINPIPSLVDKIADQDSDTKQPSSSVSWENSGQGYVAIGTPPDCPDPLFLATPVDLSKVNSILYPGQTRGGGYNAHGGFRFDGQAGDDITVTIPMDALLFEGSRYIQSGSLQ
ncbi:hypothetical protein IID19_05910, partial [Patescibacteria group bacterium]|nr:hypothetical protein [Patescibacteria group bacterium]